MTYQQKIASDPKNCVFVNASAGTGKTKVLTDRVIRLLLDGANAEKILCLTFTNAAASEMKNRIALVLQSWAIMPDGELDKQIQELLSYSNLALKQKARILFSQIVEIQNGMKIQTIHAFCQSLISKFPIEANISTSVSIIDDQTKNEFINKAWINLVNNLDKNTNDVVNAIKNFSYEIHETSLKKLINDLVNNQQKIQTVIDKNDGVNELITNLFKILNLDPNKNSKQLLQEFCNNLPFVNELKLACIEFQNSKNKAPQENSLIISKWLVADNEQRLKLFDEYKSVFVTGDNLARKKISTKDCNSYEETLKQEQLRILNLLDNLKAHHIIEKTKDILYLFEEIIAIYNGLKRKKSYLDYSDIIEHAYNLLRKPDIAPWILFKLDGGIDHILVDEAQDTNPMQWQIIKAISEEFFAGQGSSDVNKTMFVVGDEKQSIYSFQGAKPQEFENSKQYYRKEANNAQKNWQEVNMELSFRSTDAILKSVDKIFSNNNLKKAISFSDNIISHKSFRNKHAGLVEVAPLFEYQKLHDSDEKPWQIPTEQKIINTPQKQLVEYVTSKIASMINSKYILKSKGRAVNAGDFLILLSTRGTLADQLTKSLQAKGVNVAGVDRLKLTENIAIMDLLALAKFTLLPDDDLNLACVLKSPFFQFSEEQLFELAHFRGDSSLWSYLKKKQFNSDAIKCLTNLLNKVDFQSPYEFFANILESDDGRKKLISKLGYEINDPLDEFLNKTLEYEKLHSVSMQSFLSWIESDDIEIKRDLEQADNLVRIMTIHSSKGLQAPIVFMPDTINTNKVPSKFIFDEANNQYFFINPSKENSCDFITNLKEDLKKETYNEYLRLLYVALTRAEDQLYISGFETSKSKVKDDCWYGLIKNAVLAIGNKSDSGYVRYETSQEIAVNQNINKEDISSDVAINLPEFALNNAPDEPYPSMPLSPSKQNESEEIIKLNIGSKKEANYGKIVHKLLQYLPEVATENRYDLAIKFLEKNLQDGKANEIKDIATKTINITNNKDFKDIFGKNSQAEVPVVAIVDGEVVFGQIDRLVINHDKIIIVDYKTSRKPPISTDKIPKRYLKQMELYKKSIQKIYPDKQIICAIIWTQTQNITILRPDA